MEAKVGDNIGSSIQDILMKYVRHYKLYLLIGAIMYLLSFIYMRYASVYYSVKGTLLIKTKESGMLGKDDPLSQLMLYKGDNDLQNEIEILKSMTLAKRTVAALALQTRYYTIGNIKKFPYYPNKYFRFVTLKNFDTTQSIDLRMKIADSGRFTLNDLPQLYEFNKPFQTGNGIFMIEKTDTVLSGLKYMDYLITVERAEQVAVQLQGDITISPTKDLSKVLNIGMRTVHPEMASDIVNTLMSEYQKASIEEKNQIAARTITFINERLGIITKELGEVEQSLQDFKRRNQVYNINSQSELFLSSSQDLEKQLSEAEVNVQLVRYLEDYLRDKKNNFSTVPSTLGIQEPVLMSLVKEYNEIQLLREAELRTTTSENPLIKVLEGQLEKLRLSLLENLRNMKATGLQMKQKTESKIAGLNSSLSVIPLKEKELLEISRQQGIKQQLYLYLLQKREENAIALASTISNSQVVDPAMPSFNRVAPDPSNVRLISMVLALLLPTLFIYLKELLNNRVMSRKDIIKVSDIPILGEVAHSPGQDTDIFGKASRGVVSEQFRSIRSNLNYFIGRVPNPVIMVTSSFSGEGKSFCSVRLATVYAMAGKKTALLEFDIRKPKLTRSMGISGGTNGISKFVTGGISVEELPVPVKQVPNLYLVSCGPIPPNPSELLLDSKIDTIFEYLKANFDIVVVDTAPFGLVSDAIELGKFADCTIYIIRYDYTLKKHLELLKEVYQNNKLPKPSVVLNDVSAKEGYGMYGYKYAYGAGYLDEESPGSSSESNSFFSRFMRQLKGEKK
jgi:tyrosine-protein kinase Etk/Wzc